ncbi:MAG: diadenylate cyclase CdaA [Acidobacteriota bacterium]|jgi:diadenylate cyclase|nr:diadenylate cyclase CdaA [Acidobacteriota bacterium]
MDSVLGFFQITSFSFRDLIDIALVTFIVYRFLVLLKGTRGVQMTMGIVMLLLFFWVTRFLNLAAVEWLLSNVLTYIFFAIIVLYQAEIRSVLTRIGVFSIRGHDRTRARDGIDEIVQASSTLAARKIGALIILEREVGLRDYAETGIALDAVITYDLLVTIFFPKTPLHDGATIIRKNRIVAAGCFLPLTLDPHLSQELGTRHRAAIGVTEETDAVAVIVSEETGTISMAIGGRITRDYSGDGLRTALRAALERRPDARADAAPAQSPEDQPASPSQGAA